MIRAYHQARGDTGRTKMAIPDSAHGTNPASAAMAGFDVVTLPSDANGNTDLDALHQLAGPDLAGAMITLPSTLGLFDTNILKSAGWCLRPGGWCTGTAQHERAVGAGQAGRAGV